MDKCNSNVRVQGGSMCDAVIENNALIVFESYDEEKRELPLKELLDLDYDMHRQWVLAQNGSACVILRSSRTSDRLFAFFKTDSEQQTFELMPRLEEKLREEMENGRTVYMDRITNDRYDMGKGMLERLGCKARYFTGERVQKKSRRQLFKLDFTANDLYRYCACRIIGQDSELKKAVYLVWEYIESAAGGNDARPANWMLTAPSGMGKTEFYRCIHDFFKLHDVPIPVLQIDMSMISEYSFRGNNADSIVDAINTAGSCYRALPRGTAICFLDESDKIFKPSFDSHGKDIHSSVQANLLTIIEGSKNAADSNVDTRRTMFVFLGAFQDLRDRKFKEAKMISEFFENDEAMPQASDEFYSDVSIEDMIEEGLIEELAGRMTSVVNFHKIEEKQMKKIIAAKAEAVSKEIGCPVRITRSAINELMTIAYSNLGVRKPVSKIKELALNALANHVISGLDKNDVTVVICGLEKARLERRREKAGKTGDNADKCPQERTCVSA